MKTVTKRKPVLTIVPKATSLDIEEILDLITSKRSCSKIDVVVTPEMAKAMLRYNTPGVTNRRLKHASVAQIVADLQDGIWENTGEPIIFSNTGFLNNGQHRLQAIVESGITAVLDIRFGVSRRAFAATDSGNKRTGGDALTLLGIPNQTNVSAAARLVLAYEKGLPNAARRRIANQEIVYAVERWSDIAGAVKYTANLPRFLRNAAVDVLAFFALRTAKESSVKEFFGLLEAGAGSGHASSPPRRLWDVIIHHSGGQDTGTRVSNLAYCIIAWNAWQAQHRMPRITWTPDELFPKVNGLILS